MITINDLYNITENKSRLDIDVITSFNNEEFFTLKENIPNDYSPLEVLEIFNIHGSMLEDEKTGRLSMTILLNNAVKNKKRLGNDFVNHLMKLVDLDIYPLLHKGHGNELSAMCELGLFISGSENTLCVAMNEKLIADKAFKKYGIDKYNINSDELAFLTNQFCVSLALAVVSVHQAKILSKTADICTAMNLEAIRGELGAFDSRLHELARPYKNQIISAENIRRLLSDSEFTTDKARMLYGGDKGPRCQDAISLRATPQTHGGVRDIIEWVETTINEQLETPKCKSNLILGYALDSMVMALADMGNISERRAFRLNDPHMSYGLQMNLVGGDLGYNHGFPVVQASATACLADLKLLAIPNSATTDLRNRNVYNSVVKSIDSESLLSKVLSVEMLMSAQGMDLVKQVLNVFEFGKGTYAAFKAYRKFVKFTDKNRYLRDEMCIGDSLISDGSILEAVEKEVGNLK